MARTKDPKRVFIADPQPLAARGLVAILADEPDLIVTSGSPDPRVLADEVIAFGPDLVVLGLPADPAETLAVAARLGRRSPLRMIVLAEATPQFDISKMLRAGITGLLSRDASLVEVQQLIRESLAGRAVAPSQVASRLLDELAVAVRRADARLLSSSLTTRETEVLRLVADGLRNRDVANALHISENTVKNHMRSIHEKLGVGTRTEAVVTAVREGLLPIS